MNISFLLFIINSRYYFIRTSGLTPSIPNRLSPPQYIGSAKRSHRISSMYKICMYCTALLIIIIIICMDRVISCTGRQINTMFLPCITAPCRLLFTHKTYTTTQQRISNNKILCLKKIIDTELHRIEKTNCIPWFCPFEP